MARIKQNASKPNAKTKITEYNTISHVHLQGIPLWLSSEKQSHLSKRERLQWLPSSLKIISPSMTLSMLPQYDLKTLRQLLKFLAQLPLSLYKCPFDCPSNIQRQGYLLTNSRIALSKGKEQTFRVGRQLLVACSNKIIFIHTQTFFLNIFKDMKTLCIRFKNTLT